MPTTMGATPRSQPESSRSPGPGSGGRPAGGGQHGGGGHLLAGLAAGSAVPRLAHGGDAVEVLRRLAQRLVALGRRRGTR